MGLRVALIAAALALSGCAVPYQDMAMGIGVSSEQIGDDLYRITVKLGDSNSQSDLQLYGNLRAAETARDAGAPGFRVVSTRNTTASRYVSVPGTAYTTGSATTYGNTTYGTATTTYDAPISGVSVVPRGIAVIQLVRGPLQPGDYDAAKLIREIGPLVTRGAGRNTPVPSTAAIGASTSGHANTDSVSARE